MTDKASSPSSFGPPGAIRALSFATVALAVNFWAWNLLGPLAPTYRELIDLTPFQLALLVAVPALIGALARIPIGSLTDRYGGRVMFTLVSALTILPVLFLSIAGSYLALLAGGLLIGLGGAVFAIGIPFVNAWFSPERRGLALGIYGVGNIGTAVSGFVSPPIAESLGLSAPYLVVAASLAAMSLAFLLFGRDAPGRTRSTASVMKGFVAATKLPIARDLALMYAVTFGGFVAFGAYLPIFLTEVYDLSLQDAAYRAAGFIVVATVMRPAGGGLSDRFGGTKVLQWSLIAIGLGAIVTAFEPGLPIATVGFQMIAAALGAGNGAVFALVGTRVPATQVGSVTGLVGAAGGLGGFFPPLVMGVVFQATGSYAIGLMLLSDVAFAGAVYTAWRLGDRASSGSRRGGS
jgi:NNP family nitrate/nitrite transporter-like MFS transporter